MGKRFPRNYCFVPRVFLNLSTLFFKWKDDRLDAILVIPPSLTFREVIVRNMPVIMSAASGSSKIATVSPPCW